MIPFLAAKPLIRYAAYVAAAIAVIALVGWGVHTYNDSLREDGRAEVQAKWNAEKGAAEQARLTQEEKWRGERDARERAEKERDDERSKRALLAKDRTRRDLGPTANVALPPSVRGLLNDTIDGSNQAFAARPASEPTAKTAGPTEAITVEQWATWSLECINRFEEARGMVEGWQAFYSDLRTP